MKRTPVLIFCLTLLAGFALSISDTSAYQKYEGSPSCSTCHSGFIGGPGNPLHDMHLQMTSNCSICHTSIGDNPNLATGGVGLGCNGCHLGPGLRAHHKNAGVPAPAGGSTCAACHPGDPTPPPESTVPSHYSRMDVSVKDPCQALPAPPGEDFNGDGKGLDNDGNLLYDAADPACGSTVTTTVQPTTTTVRPTTTTTVQPATTTVPPTTTTVQPTTTTVLPVTTTTVLATTTTVLPATTTTEPPATTTVPPTTTVPATGIVNAIVDIYPDTLNVNHTERSIIAKITLPETYNAEDIVQESIELCIDKNASPEQDDPENFGDDGEHNVFHAFNKLASIPETNPSDIVCSVKPLWAVVNESVSSLTAKFPNQEVLKLISENIKEFPASFTFVVSGNLEDGSSFSGTARVRVYNYLYSHDHDDGYGVERSRAIKLR